MTDAPTDTIDLGRLAIIGETCATPENGLTVEIVTLDTVAGLSHTCTSWHIPVGSHRVTLVEIRALGNESGAVIGQFAAYLNSTAEAFDSTDVAAVPSTVLAIGDAGGPALLAFVESAAERRVERRVNAEEPGGGLLSLGMLREVPLEVSAELGRTRLSVAEILQLTVGSVVELDRTAGAPVDVMVNGSLIARGEVVVIDDEYGVRITEIVGRIGDAI